MRQGNWRVAAVGLLAVSLLCAPAFAGSSDKASDQLFMDVRSKAIAESGSSEIGPPSATMDMGPFQPEPSGLAQKYDIVWDNQFRAEALGIMQGNVCSTLDCGTLWGYIADDINLPSGTVVNGFRMRFGFAYPTVWADVEGAVFTIWPDDNGKPGNAGTGGDDGWVFRALVSAGDLGMKVFSEGTTYRRVEVEFNPGEQWVAPGGKFWVSMTPVIFTPPGAYGFMTLYPINQHPGWQSWSPIDPDRPWGTDPPPYPGELQYDMQFQLYGERPVGGTTVVGIGGNPGTAACAVRLLVSQESVTSCTVGDCTTDCASCEASIVLTGGESASQVAAALALNFTTTFPEGCACSGGTVTMKAAGRHVVVETNNGPRPSVCLGGDGSGYRLVGGPVSCRQNGCNLTYEVGLRDDQVLPEIPPGTDWLTSDRSCTTNNGTGAWANLSELGGTTAGLFDRPGMPATDTVADQRIAMRGVGRGYYNDDTDTIVDRLEPMIFGLCSGDFIDTGNGGATVANPDGVVDTDDGDSFFACLGQYGLNDCALFDFDGDTDVDADDNDVFDCLLASHNDTDCCPENLTYPQSVVIATQLDRLHLRSCDPIAITRKGQNKGKEWWWIDHYISGVPPGAGSEQVLGTPCDQSDTELNNVAGAAEQLGFLGRDTPIRKWGSISDTGCDLPAQAQPGQKDADVFMFSIAFTDLVSFSVRGRGTAGACEGDCACDEANMAVTSLHVFDEDGTALLASIDPPPPFPTQSPIVDPTIDPSVAVVLAPGTYVVVVASAAQNRIPFPNDTEDPKCAVDEDIADVPYGDAGPTTGDYELNVAIVERSTMLVTQTDGTGGTFDSKLLVQSLVTFQRTADPFSVVVIDTGELGMGSVALYAENESWVNELSETDPDVADVIVSYDAEGFVPGVSDDGAGDQDVDPIQHRNDPSNSTVVHLVSPPMPRGCTIIENGCVYIQGPDDDSDAIGAARGITDNFPVADDFTLASTTTIMSVTFWLMSAGDTDDDDVFDINFYTDGAFGNCASGPATLVTEFTGLEPEVIRSTALNDADRVTFNLPGGFVATGGVKYWMEVVQDLVEGPGQVFFMVSAAGNGVMYRDLDPLKTVVGGEGSATNCPDFSLDGDGWDCDPYTDDEAGSSSDCDEAACGNGDADCEGTAYPGDMVDNDLAFCLGQGTVQAWTKDLPSDVASGNWHYRPGNVDRDVWNQPATGASGNLQDVSDRVFPTGDDPNLGQQCADDFTFFEDTTITDIHWRGRYDTYTPDVMIPLGDRFTIEIWDDDLGLPGTLLKEYPTLNSVTRVPGQLTARGGGGPGWQISDYFVDLTLETGGAFVAAKNTTYWLSIINDSTGSARYWFWVRGEGGNSNVRAAVRDIGDPWAGQNRDKSFDLTISIQADKIIAVKSIDCDPIQGTHLGYYFDSTHCYINGYQPKQGDDEAQENYWRAVRAPWKIWQEIKLQEELYPATEQGLIDAFAATKIELPADYLCLITPEHDGKFIQGLFEGIAAYDITNDLHGIEVGGVIYRECNGQVIDAEGDPSDILNPEDELLGQRERLHVVGVTWDQQWDPESGVATALISVMSGPECYDDLHCKRCDVCYRENCNVDGECTQDVNRYGDVDGNGTINVFDLFRVLDGFGGEFSITTFQDVDINPCAGNDTISIFDLFGVLNAFGGIDPCCCGYPVNDPPPPHDSCAEYGDPNACPGPAPDRSAERSVSGDRAVRAASAPTIKLVASQRTAQPGDLVDVDVYISGASNVRGAQLNVKVDGGRRGSLNLVSVSVDQQRKTFLLNGVENVIATDQRGRLAVAGYNGGVSAAGSAYVGTFTFEVSGDAAGAFRVGLSVGDQETTVVAADGTSRIEIGRITPAMISVTRGR